MKEVDNIALKFIFWLLIVFVGFICTGVSLSIIVDINFIAAAYIALFVPVFFVFIFAPSHNILGAVISVLPYLLFTMEDITIQLRIVYVSVPVLICNIILYLIFKEKNYRVFPRTGGCDIIYKATSKNLNFRCHSTIISLNS